MSALSVQVRDLRTQLEAQAESMTTVQADLVTAQEAVATFEGQATAHAEAIEQLTTSHAESIAGFESQIAELTEQATAATAELEAVQTELTQANDQLADPAFADAAAEGQEPEPVASTEDAPSLERFKALKGADQFAYFKKYGDQLI